MILVRVASSNLGQVSRDCNSRGRSLHAFPKFLPAMFLYQYKGYFVGSWVRKGEWLYEVLTRGFRDRSAFPVVLGISVPFPVKA